MKRIAQKMGLGFRVKDTPCRAMLPAGIQIYKSYLHWALKSEHVT